MKTEIIENLTNRDIIRQSHGLNLATFNVSALALDLLYLLLTEISTEDKCLSFKIQFKDLEKKMGKKINRMDLERAAEELNDTKVRIVTDKVKFSSNWCSSVSWISESNSKTLKLNIDPDLKEHLMNFSKDKPFSLSYFNMVTKVKSSYGKRIYTILSQYKKSGRFIIATEKLSQILKTENKYSKYSDFKRRVLEPALKQINKETDISFKYEELKKGGKVVNLKFIITSNKKAKAVNPVGALGDWYANQKSEEGVIDAEVL